MELGTAQPQLVFLLFLKLKNYDLCAMKQILYDTANQTKVNRAVHSKGKREKGLCMNILNSQQHNTVKSDPIYKNFDQIMGYCA